MKKLLLASTLAIMSASSFASTDDHSGFRIGGGFGSDVGKYQIHGLGESRSVSADPVFILEAGYDFNEIFALNVKGNVTTYTDYGDNPKNYRPTWDLTVEGEAGYTFVTDKGFSIKPYAALGAVAFDSTTSSGLGESGTHAIRTRGALGARMTLDSGLYFDGRLQATDLTPKPEKFNSKDHLLTQAMLTVGYKF
ncbi:outer membrane beta-barrel protein [Vibrio superstes]|nr:outer membrane beta-barrel protein [Vibrio superstes]